MLHGINEFGNDITYDALIHILSYALHQIVSQSPYHYIHIVIVWKSHVYTLALIFKDIHLLISCIVLYLHTKSKIRAIEYAYNIPSLMKYHAVPL